MLHVPHLEVVRGEADDLAVLQVGHPRRVRRDGDRVAGEQVLALAQADHERAAEPRPDHLAGAARADDAQAVGPLQPRQGTLDGREEVLGRFQLAGDQVGDDLGVGLAGEGEALGLELAPEYRVVLDDAVVHHGHRGRAASAAEVRVRIAVGGRPVGRPSRVADPATPRRRLGLEQLLERAHPPRALRTTMPPRSRVASPALSYPRYSSRRSPPTRIGAAWCDPVYPTIPHMRRLLSLHSAAGGVAASGSGFLGKIDASGQRKPGITSSPDRSSGSRIRLKLPSDR